MSNYSVFDILHSTLKTCSIQYSVYYQHTTCIYNIFVANYEISLYTTTVHYRSITENYYYITAHHKVTHKRPQQ